MPGNLGPIGNAVRAAAGSQANITGDGTTAGFDSATLASSLANLAPGTYLFQLPTQGATACDVRLQCTHTTVVPTASLYATYADGTTSKGTVVNFAAYPGDSTDWTASITTLRGEIVTMLAIVVPATATLTITKAEFSCL